MGMPLVIDNMALTLGRFIWSRQRQRVVGEDRMVGEIPASETVAPEHITLSSGQMLLPGITAPHSFGN